MNVPPTIIWVVTVTLSAVIIVVCTALMIGLFDANVDNKEIFGIIGPAFQTIVGAFVLAIGKMMGRSERDPSVLCSRWDKPHLLQSATGVSAVSPVVLASRNGGSEPADREGAG